MAEDRAERNGGLDERLTMNVLEELRSQNALMKLGLSDDQLARLSWSIAVNIDYAFDAKWSPRWEQPRP